MSEEQAPKRKKVSNTEKRRNARSFVLQALYSQELTKNPTNEVEAHFRVDNDMAIYRFRKIKTVACLN